MSNFAIARAGLGKIGAVGAAASACVDIGSIKTVKFEISQEVKNATAANLNDMVVEQAYGPMTGTLTLELEEITSKNLALVMGASASGDVSGAVYEDAASTTPTYYSGYFNGFKVGGVAKALHVCKFAVKPGSTVSLDGEQQVLTMECEVMVDPTSTFTTSTGNAYKVYALIAEVS